MIFKVEITSAILWNWNIRKLVNTVILKINNKFKEFQTVALPSTLTWFILKEKKNVFVLTFQSSLKKFLASTIYNSWLITKCYILQQEHEIQLENIQYRLFQKKKLQIVWVKILWVSHIKLCPNVDYNRDTG